MDLEEVYDKIYRYCYFRLRQRELAEDVTQEAFLRFFESGCANVGKDLRYLYTIARNLCIDEFRRRRTEPLDDEISDGFSEEEMFENIAVWAALAQLDEADRELLLLRYVNEVSVAVIGKIYGISRFAVYRRAAQAVKKLKEKLGGEDFL